MNDRSRYRDADEFSVPGPHGLSVRVSLPARRTPAPRRGTHARRDGERLDHLAAHYLRDPAGFWQICDANDALLPEALSDVSRIDIPEARR